MREATIERLPPTLTWTGGDDGLLRLIDQTQLPRRLVMCECRTAADVRDAIRRLAVRGAPAIGVAAAYGLCLGTRNFCQSDAGTFLAGLRQVGEDLCAARPTAVNLAWAVRRVTVVGQRAAAQTPVAAWSAMLAEAHALAREDADSCRRIGEIGADLVPEGAGVLTHCNAGALATVAHGTALSVLYAARQRGRHFRVFADETRPLFQGARLTAYELKVNGIEVTVLCDSAAGALMHAGQIHLVIVGADRIAANGDTANKTGTYGLAVLARHHDIPFYVAAPRSTFDLSLPDGSGIPIEFRSEQEVRGEPGRETVPAGVPCYNPAFDVTPAALITAIITDEGLAQPVTAEKIKEICRGGGCVSSSAS